MARIQHTFRSNHRREELTARLVERLQATSDPGERDCITAQLVQVNLPLCDALAARYAGRGAELEDLTQVARTALVVAVQQFQADLGKSLAAFAVPTISGEIKRYFRDRCWMVRPPRALQEMRPTALWALNHLEQSCGRSVSLKEVADYLRVDHHTVEESLWNHDGYRPVSLDSPVRDDLMMTLGSQLSDECDMAEEVTDRLALRAVLQDLSPRDAQIIVWRFEEECTQSEIASRLGVSQMQVSRILKRILADLRSHLEAVNEESADWPIAC